MNIERSILVTFFGNYLINTVAAALVAIIPAGGSSGYLSPQYITFVVLALAVVAGLAWWEKVRGWKAGLIFGAIGFAVSIVTALVTGLASVLGQTGSFTQMAGILPNFWPFLWNISTLILLCYWLIAAGAVGFLKGQGMRMHAAPASPAMPTSTSM